MNKVPICSSITMLVLNNQWVDYYIMAAAFYDHCSSPHVTVCASTYDCLVRIPHFSCLPCMGLICNISRSATSIAGANLFLLSYMIITNQSSVSVGMYYRRKRKPSDPINNLSLTANTIRSWGCGSVTEEWDSLYAQKVQLFTFLSTLPEPALSYGLSVETNMANSIEQREQKKSDIIVLDLDDDDESTGAHKQLMPEKNKQLTPEKNKQLIHQNRLVLS